MTILSPNESRTLLLDDKQVVQRINRLAFQIYEDNSSETDIVFAGIVKSGYQLAAQLKSAIENISPLKITLAEVHLDKHSQNSKVTLSTGLDSLQGKVVILIDDVLNSGKTMMYALKPFLEADIKKIRTVVLVDRNHKRFPVAADFAGLSLSTTLKEHISVEFEGSKTMAWLS